MQTGWFWRYKLHHVLCWLLVFGVWFFLRLGDYPSWQKTAEVTALKVADLALLVYITNYVLLPRLFLPEKISVVYRVAGADDRGQQYPQDETAGADTA